MFEKTGTQHIHNSKVKIERLLKVHGVHSSEIDIRSHSLIRKEQEGRKDLAEADSQSRVQEEAEEEAPAAPTPTWQKVLDPSSGKFYYHNLSTGETQWEEPQS